MSNYTEPGSRFSFADPAIYCELKELRSCNGCAHERVAFHCTKYCDKGRVHGKKCDHYRPVIGNQRLEGRIGD